MATRFSLLTLFPRFFDSPMAESLIGKAIESGLIAVDRVDLREFGVGKHRVVDDKAFGGGPGMVMRPDVAAAAIRKVRTPESRVIYLTPAGTPLTQPLVMEWAALPHLVLLCGRYEGVDERALEAEVHQRVSIGDYILSGGEAAAWVIVEAVGRLVPGVVGNGESLRHESFEDGLLAPPVYTRPDDWEGARPPDVLLSGHHAEIEKWRQAVAGQRTRQVRPDLWARREKPGPGR